jgi:hypothetical protein
MRNNTVVVSHHLGVKEEKGTVLTPTPARHEIKRRALIKNCPIATDKVFEMLKNISVSSITTCVGSTCDLVQEYFAEPGAKHGSLTLGILWENFKFFLQIDAKRVELWAISNSQVRRGGVTDDPLCRGRFEKTEYNLFKRSTRPSKV